MVWSEVTEQQPLAALLAPYEVKTARVARALVRLSARCARRGQR